VVDAKGEIVVTRKLTRGRFVPFFAELAPDGGVLLGASLGAGADRTRARGSIAAARACEAPAERGYFPSLCERRFSDHSGSSKTDAENYRASR